MAGHRARRDRRARDVGHDRLLYQIAPPTTAVPMAFGKLTLLMPHGVDSPMGRGEAVPRV